MDCDVVLRVVQLESTDDVCPDRAIARVRASGRAFLVLDGCSQIQVLSHMPQATWILCVSG
eukprot:6422550-Heterocapsa_arctica.AAC.1